MAGHDSGPMSDASPSTIPQAIARHALGQPDKEAVCFLAGNGAPRAVTYARLHADARAASERLLQQGLKPGQVVVLAFDFGYPLVAAFLGALYAGAVPAIFPGYLANAMVHIHGDRVQRMVHRTGARAVLTRPGFVAALSGLAQGFHGQVLGIDPDNLDGCTMAAAPLPTPHPEDTAYIQFSSGSTGRPRGVTISHRAALHAMFALAEIDGFRPADVSVGWLPFYHDMGLVGQLLMPLVVGGQAVQMAPRTWLRAPAKLMQAIHSYRGTINFMPNFGFLHCARHITEKEMLGIDLSSLKALGCGGEPIEAGVLQWFVQRFRPYGLNAAAILPGYGLAENTFTVSYCGLGESVIVDRICRHTMQNARIARPTVSDHGDAIEVVSCGRPVTGTEVSIVNETGELLPERCIGEIRVRGEALFSGYHRDPEATRRAVRDGWLHTGDLGYLAEGRLYVVDRKKDLIISAGRNIYPHLVEEAILAVAGTQARRAVVFGVLDKGLGTELPVAVVEVRGKTDDTKCSRLSRKIGLQVRSELDVGLADVRVVRSGWIETTTSGKLARNATRAKYLAEGWQPRSAEDVHLDLKAAGSLSELESALARMVAAATGITDIDPEAHLSDLGVDSLALMQVLLGIEKKLGRHFPADQFALHPTIRSLARLLQKNDLPTAPRQPRPAGNRRLYAPAVTEQKRPGPGGYLLRRGPAAGGRALPYGLGTRLLAAVACRPALRQRLYAGQIDLVRRCLAQLPVRQEAETVIRQSLMVNTWPVWRQCALKGENAFGRWVTVKGAHVLRAHETEGRGIVLAFHHTELKKLLRRLPELRDRELAAIGNIGAANLAAQGMPHVAAAVADGEALCRVAVHSAQMVQAMRVLREGGVVVVLADDDDGTGGIEFPFHGRLRPLRPGAAELALRGEALLVPLFAAMDETGHVTFEFLDPLAPEGERHDQRVNSLLRQYATLLADRYTTSLGAMEWYILRKFLRYPEI